MSGAISATTALAVGLGATAVTAAAGLYGSMKQSHAQKKAAAQAQKQNEITQEQAREDMRRQNAQEADLTSIYEQNLDAGASGGSTMLTGAGGIANSDLTLGKGNKLGA